MSAHDRSKSASQGLTRRRFLSTALAVAGGSAAAGALAEEAAAGTPAAAPADGNSQTQGYRETGHIQAYYRAARF